VTTRNRIMLEILVVGVLTVVSTIILLQLNIGGVVGSVVSLWALMFMLLYNYIVT
jgi:hypothetical protein